MDSIREGFLYKFLEFMSVGFVFVLGLFALFVLVVYISDVTQTKHAIRRNYPVIGHFRYFFEHLGEFFRQYFFAMDREELPFNRAERSWCYRAAKDLDNTVAFGSTRNLRPTGTVMFVNCPFPSLTEEQHKLKPVTIGPYARKPYTTSNLFHISAMSYGSLSAPAVEALAGGAAKVGSWINTGEGGLSPFHLKDGAHVVFQLGTAKFGARNADATLHDERLKEITSNDQVKMVEIKLSQGAKPGKGGILPGVKVTAEIAAIRGIPEGESALSPNRHVDVNSVEDLLDLIARIRDVSGLPTGYKAVVGAYGWLDTMFEEVNRRGVESAPDFITVDGADGGTGAAPMSLMDDVGLPLREGLPMVIDALVRNGLRDRVKVIASGKLITPTEVAWAMCMGADFVASARGNMFALGCIQALQCNKNTCPTGITTHDTKLQRGLVPEEKAERVASYIRNITKEVEVIAHSCGVPEPRRLKRYHARMVTENGRSMPLDELFPVETSREYSRAEQHGD